MLKPGHSYLYDHGNNSRIVEGTQFTFETTLFIVLFVEEQLSSGNRYKIMSSSGEVGSLYVSTLNEHRYENLNKHA